MSVQIISDGTNAAMFCDTSDWAFGPVSYADDPEEELQDFCGWLPRSVRSYADQSELESLWHQFRDERDAKPDEPEHDQRAEDIQLDDANRARDSQLGRRVDERA